MDVPARAGRDRAVSTGSAGPVAGKGAVPPRSSRGCGQPVSPTGAEAAHRQLFDSFDRDRDDKVTQWVAVLNRPLAPGPLGRHPLSDAEGNDHTQVAEPLRQAVRDIPEVVAV
jgi:hypothetical protein